MFKRLLVPLDESPLAEQALGVAAAIAQACRAEMDLVLVHRPIALDGASDAPWSEAAFNEGRRYVESIAAQLSSASSIPITQVVLRGGPVEKICRRVRDRDADLVVMTSHGRTGLSRAWLGSIADGVMRHATVPVLMLRPAESQPRRDVPHQLFKRVLVPTDGSELSAAVFRAAAALAKCGNAHITLLRVVQPVVLISLDRGIPWPIQPTLIDSRATQEAADSAREQLLSTARALHNETGTDVDAHVVVDAPVATAILDFAGARQTDVIAMSTRGRGMSRFRIGSVADKVLRGSSLPTLLFRPAAVRGGTRRQASPDESAGNPVSA